MVEVAEELRRALRRQVAAMTPAERVELSLRLGDDDLEAFRLAHGLSREEARCELSRRRQQGRIPSRCLETPGR